MDEVNYLNKGFYKDLDTNFEQAYYMCERSFEHEELSNMLRNGNIPQKQIAALRFDYVSNIEDAELLLDNLTGCDGKIREAVAYTVNRILITQPEAKKFFVPISADVFAASTIDINANICRYTVDNAVLLREDNDFSVKYTENIVKYTKEAYSEIEKFIFRDKKYVINKQIFKLYWCLEALRFFYMCTSKDVMTEILEKAVKQNEYTVREKAAQIVLVCNDFPEIRKSLENDENYYVREVFSRQKSQI